MDVHGLYLIVSLVLLAIAIKQNVSRARNAGVRLVESVMRPSQLMTLYVIIFYIFGSLFYLTGNILREDWINSSRSWSTSAIVIYAATMFIALLATNWRPRLSSQPAALRVGSAASYSCAFLGLGGAAGGWLTGEYIFYLVTIVAFFCAFGNEKPLPAWLIFAALAALLILLPQGSFSKRNILFPAAIFMLFLFHRGDISHSRLSAFALMLLLIIIPMSIFRGYGNYHPDTFWDAITFTWDYVRSPNFMKSYANNMEFSSFYFHGVNSVEVFSMGNMFLYGETVVRALLAPLFYFSLIDGLETSIDIYTRLFDPSYRARGGSYPVNLMSELYMNFGVFTVLLYAFLMRGLDALYAKSWSSAYGYIRFGLSGPLLFSCLLLARGASFSLFMFNYLLMVIVFMFIYILMQAGRRIRPVQLPT